MTNSFLIIRIDERRRFLQNAGVLGIVPLISAPFTANRWNLSPPRHHPQILAKLSSKTIRTHIDRLADDQLKQKMPVEVKEPSLITDRAKYTHLEAFGRLLCGIASLATGRTHQRHRKTITVPVF